MKRHFSTISRALTAAVSAGFLFSVIPASAQKDSAASSAQAKKDYSSGFAKFYKLGLPKAQGATYVKLDLYSGTYHSGGMHDLMLKGNAWMIDENEDGPSTFITDDCKVVKVYDIKQLQRIRAEEMKKEEEEKGEDSTKSSSGITRYYGQDKKGRIGGKWRKVLLERDVKKVLDYVKKASEDEDSRRRFSYSDSYGTLFIKAIHFHANGFEDEANEIVGLLFDMSPDRRQVILQGFNSLADSRFDEAMTKFFRDGDWKALQADLATTLRTFSTGWKKGLAVKRLFDKVKQRVAQTEPPAIPGLSKEEQSIADELASLGKDSDGVSDPYMYGHGNYIWVLPDKRKKTPGDPDKEPGVLDKIRAGGMKSVPLLLALAEDDYLTAADMNRMGGTHYYSSSRGGPMTEEQITQIYSSLRRPATRGEIAVRLLQVLPLNKDRYTRQQESEEVIAQCREWYEENKDKTPLELAKAYIASPNSQQRSSGMRFLLQSGGEEERKLLEEKFLSDDPEMMMDSSMVYEYVSMRQEKAKDFVARYEAHLKKKMDSSDNGMFKNEGNKKQVESTVKRLKSMVEVVDAPELLAEILAGKKKFAEESQSLYRAFSKMKTNEALDLILDSVLKAKDAKLRTGLLGIAANAKYFSRYSSQYGRMYDEAEKEEQEDLTIEDNADQWRKLLADKSATEGGRWGWSSQMTIAAMAAWTIEALYSDDNGMEARTSIAGLGMDLYDLLEKRAEERLQGKSGEDLTDFPSADKVDEKHLAALKGKLKLSKGAALAKVIAGITADERLALIAYDDDDEVMNLNVAPYALIIREVESNLKDAAQSKALEEMKNKRVGKALVESFKKTCEEAAKAGKVIGCTISRRSGLKGVALTVKEYTSESDEYKQTAKYYGRMTAKKNTAQVRGSLTASSLRANAVWHIEVSDAKAEKDVKEESTEDDEMDSMLQDALGEMMGRDEEREVEAREEFWKNVDDFLAGREDVFSSGYISFSGIPVLPELEEDDAEQY